MNEAGSRTIGGMTSRHSNQTHQDVIDRIRQRVSGYKKHHSECQKKYAHSLPKVHDLERQEAMNLRKRAVDRNRIINVNGKATKQNDGEGKLDAQQQQITNGFDKSSNAILHIREQILMKKRKHEQNLSDAINSFAPSNDDGSTLGGDCVNKFQRQDGLLQVSESSVANQSHQVGHPTAQLNQMPFGAIENSYIQDCSVSTARISTTIGAETCTNGGQGLSSSFLPTDFKQENTVIVSCEETTVPNKTPGTVANGLNQGSSMCTGQEFIQQQLRYIDHVIQARFNEDGAPTQTIQHQTKATVQACDDDRAHVPETQLLSRHPKSHQLKEFARKSQLAQQVVPYRDRQDHGNHQFSHQHATQYSLASAGQPSPGVPYPAGKYPGPMPKILNEQQQQMLQEPNHPIASMASGFPHHFESPHHQVGLASQPQQLQQHQQQQKSYYGLPQNNLPSSKLSHMPARSQELYSQRYQSQPVLPTSQGAALVRPAGSHNITRYSMPRSQPVYQRQTSMPPLQGQTFLNSDSQYQQQVPTFQGDQSGYSNSATELAATYHYQRRNSFPMYRNSGQVSENLSFRMQQNVGTSQASLLRGVLQNSSQSIPSDRDYLVNPTRGMALPTTLQTGPLLTGRPPSTNVDLNSAVPKKQQSSILYRSAAPQQCASVLPQGGKFQATSDSRKMSNESSYKVLNPNSTINRDVDERQTTASSGHNDTQFNAYSPLNTLDKASSFTSLLEQSAINPGNLETTYTGSIPNLELLGEILGQ